MKVQKIDLKIIRGAARVLRCLGHPERLRIVECLEREAMPVLELMRTLKLDQVSVSKHLAVLKKEKIVESKAEGHFRYYSILNPNVLKLLNCIRRDGDI